MSDYASLRGIAAETKGPAKQAWTPPTATDFLPGYVIGVDPSFNATGVVIMQSTQSGVEVTEAHTLTTDAPGKGQQHAAEQIDHMIDKFLELISVYAPGGWEIAIEAPITGGGKVQRPESSWAAGAAVRTAARMLGHTVVPLVYIPTHKRLTGGLGTLAKAQHHRILKGWAGSVVGGWHRVTNEAKLDAASVAMAHLLRSPK